MYEFSRLYALYQTIQCSYRKIEDLFEYNLDCNDKLDFGLKFNRIFIEENYHL